MRVKFIVLILLQLLLLAGMIAYREHWVATGESILLRTEPVDPRSLFRGDYVRLTYEITNLDLDELSAKEKFMPNENVYVSLVRNKDNTYSASAVSKTQPQSGKFIRGRSKRERGRSTWEVSIKDETGKIQTFKPRRFYGVKEGDRHTFCIDESGNVISHFRHDAKYQSRCVKFESVTGTVESIKETRHRLLNIKYGIESYFIEEGTGKIIETAHNARKVTVEISLREDGKGIITALFLDGKAVSR